MPIILPILYKDDPKGLRAAERRLKNFAKNVGRVTAVGFAVAGLAAVKFGADSVQAFADAEASQAKLAFAFEKFPKLADTNIKALQKLNTQLAKKTRFDDDAIAVGQATLAQYRLTGKQIQTLTPLVADYAARTGRSFEESAKVIGKAMLGQGRALKEVGIDFTDSGTLAGNFKQIVKGLGKTVAGFAEKDVQTAAGKLENLKNQFGELQEQIGEALLPDLIDLMTFFQNSVLPKLQKVGDYVRDTLVPAFKKLKDFVVENKDVIGPLAAVFGVLAGALTLVIAAFAAPIPTAIIASVGFLALYITNAIVLFDVLKKNVPKVFETIAKAMTAFSSNFYAGVLGLIGNLAGFLQSTINMIISRFLNPFIEKLNAVLSIFGVKKFSLIGNVDLTSSITAAQNALSAQGRAASGQGSGGGTPPRAMARGGLVTGRQKVLVGESGPEIVAPYKQFMETLGMSKGGGGATYNVTVNAGIGTDGVSVGREIVKAIKRYERASGPVFAGA